MTDPFDALREPVTPVDTGPGFAARLRDRLTRAVLRTTGRDHVRTNRCTASRPGAGLAARADPVHRRGRRPRRAGLVRRGVRRRAARRAVRQRRRHDRPRRGRHRRRRADVRRGVRPVARRAGARAGLADDVQPHAAPAGRRRGRDHRAGPAPRRGRGTGARRQALRPRRGDRRPVRPPLDAAPPAGAGHPVPAGRRRPRHDGRPRTRCGPRSSTRRCSRCRSTPGSQPGAWGTDETRPHVGIWSPEGVAPGIELVFRVDDLAAALDRVRAAGGIAGEAEHKPYGRKARCEDDQGVDFELWQPPD